MSVVPLSAIQAYRNKALCEVTMREVQASDAKAQFPSLLDAVEHGETVIITRDGKPIARMIPETDRRQAQVEQVFAEIEEFRKTMPRISDGKSSQRATKGTNTDVLVINASDTHRHLVCGTQDAIRLCSRTTIM